MRWLFLALALVAAPAKADTVTITFEGTVASYSWAGSRFVVGNSLSGDPFTTVWTVDACRGCQEGQVLAVTLTIGEQVFPYAVGGYAPALTSGRQIYLNDTVVSGSVALNSFVTTLDVTFPGVLTTPFSYRTIAEDNQDTPFNLGGSFWLNPGPDGYLRVESVSLANPSFVVPAPSGLFFWRKR